MRLEHQIKNVVNRIDEKSSETPGQKDGNQEHPISKKTSDYEEKFFQHASEKDDRDKFITGKKPEHKDNVEDTEGHTNPTKKTHGKNGENKPEAQEEVEDLDEIKKGFFMSDKSSNYAMSGYMPQSMVTMIRKAQNQFDWYPAIGQNGAKEDDKVVFKFEKPDGNTISGKPMSGKYKGKMFDYIIKPDNFKVPDAELKKHRLKDDMNIDLKQVENLQEKKVQKDEDFMAKIAHAAKKGKKEVKIGDKTHKVTMDKDVAHKITKKEELSWEDAVKLATDTRSQSTKEYWEEKVKEKQEGWGGKGGVAGKGTVTTIRPKNGKK